MNEDSNIESNPAPVLIVRISREYFREITGENKVEYFSGCVARIKNDLFFEWGAIYPPFQIEYNEAIVSPSFEVDFGFYKENIQGLPKGKILVQAADSEIIQNLEFDFVEDPLLPAFGNYISDSSNKKEAIKAELKCWEPFEYMLTHLLRLLDQKKAEFLATSLVETHLENLRKTDPSLVDLAINRLDSSEITQLLRALLEEGICIRDLRGILQSIVDADYIVADEGKWIVLDDRVAYNEDKWTGSVGDILKFVRAGLRDQMSYKLAPSGTLFVNLMDPSLESRIVNEYPEMPEDLLSDVIDATKLGFDNWDSTNLPTLLTNSTVRPLLRDIIKSELPEVKVLAYTELASYLKIKPINRISI